MKKYQKPILPFILVLALLLSTLVGAAPTVNVGTTNGTEFNTTTPSVIVTCTDNLNATLIAAVRSTNSTFNHTDPFYELVSNTTVDNATATTITLNSITAPAEVYYKVTCSNGSNTATGSQLFLKVNNQPSITSVSSTAGYVPKLKPITFTALWSDNNITNDVAGGTTATDGNALYVCDTNSFLSGACGGNQLCASNNETDGSTSCAYTVPASSTSGTKTGYAFMVDDNNYVSSVLSVAYRIAGSSGSAATGTATTQTQSIIPEGINADGNAVGIFLLVLIGGVVYYQITKKKK